MDIISKEELDNIRDKLLTASKTQPVEQKSGYVNGVLDFYIEAKNIMVEKTVREGEVRI